MSASAADKELANLLSRAEELFERAERGELTYTAFLTPQQIRRVQLHFSGASDKLIASGGYADAERGRVYFLPPYIAELEAPCRAELLRELQAESLVAVLVRGSGYAKLAHRDYLGAVLGLGIERDAIGDVCVQNDREAVLFCDSLMAAFLAENLQRVGNDAVQVQQILLPADFDGGKRFVSLTDTVASPRADAVVAALCNLSRERAQRLFLQELVEVDYEPCQKYDKELTAGTTLTVRGHGKFIIRSISDKTKKGRLRLVADRYQ